MSDDAGSFLGRWSRRKQAARMPAAQPAPEPPPSEFPLAELPPIESLQASSDFAPFLQKGVAAALQSRALKVAWTGDPAIAGFRGMADYDWDFNAVSYGRLRPADDVGRLLRAVLAPGADLPGDGAPGAETPVAPSITTVAPTVTTVAPPPEPVAEVGTLQPRPVTEPAPVRRHGSAKPA